jgi:hypothetical protein
VRTFIFDQVVSMIKFFLVSKIVDKFLNNRRLAIFERALQQMDSESGRVLIS